jgi:predicted AAA+ superfamily ATPase
MYIRRQLEDTITRANRFFSVIMVTGPRQSGKTTLLTHLRDPNRRIVSLDDLELRRLAQNEPKLFIEQFPPPVMIDEFQYAPNLLPYIKIAVDELRTLDRNEEAAGLYWLTGSRHFLLMKNVRESLAGRVAILELLGFSPSELLRPTEFMAENIFGQDYKHLSESQVLADSYQAPQRVFASIINGSLPQVHVSALDQEQRKNFYSNYVQTYLERDVSALDGVRNLGGFETFLRLLAGRAGQLLNLSELSRDAGVSVNTIKEWVAILQRSFHIILLAPFFRSFAKRLVRTPKVYFLDSGLHAYLTGWHEPEQTMQGPLAGQLFENWVVSNILRSFRHRGQQDDVFFWRTRTGQELDLWYESAGKVSMAEIRLSARLDPSPFRFLKHIDPAPAAFGRRILFTLSRELVEFKPGIWNVPVHFIN